MGAYSFQNQMERDQFASYVIAAFFKGDNASVTKKFKKLCKREQVDLFKYLCRVYTVKSNQILLLFDALDKKTKKINEDNDDLWTPLINRIMFDPPEEAGKAIFDLFKKVFPLISPLRKNQLADWYLDQDTPNQGVVPDQFLKEFLHDFTVKYDFKDQTLFDNISSIDLSVVDNILSFLSKEEFKQYHDQYPAMFAFFKSEHRMPKTEKRLLNLNIQHEVADVLQQKENHSSPSRKM